MKFSVTSKALLLAAVVASPAAVGASRSANGFVRAPLGNAVPALSQTVQDSAAGARSKQGTAVDSTKRDSAGGRGGQGGQSNQSSAQGLSGLSLLVLAVIGAGVVAAAFVYLMFWRTHKDTQGEIPIIFHPREHVPAVPDFPSVQPAQFRRSQPEPVMVNNAGNHKPVVQGPAPPNPAQGTMQLLPGRLEVTAGLNAQKEFRFVRVPGQDDVTFGRYPGELHTHIQVDSPTVSRKHASMRFHMGEWRITNLSSTNPVVVNGEQLPTKVERVLNDGDQVEMGEVIFRFHSR